jgi:type VI secretion system protein ImpL
VENRPQPQLTGEVRKILLRQIGVRNAENTLYQNVLKQVSRNYADITLADMTGDTLADPLSVPNRPYRECLPVRHGKDR